MRKKVKSCVFKQVGDYRICSNCDQDALKRPPTSPRIRRECPGRHWYHQHVFKFLTLPFRYAWAYFLFAWYGFKKVSKATRLRRYKTCVKCKYFLKPMRRYRACKICACNLKEKVQWPRERCPAKKW